MGAADLDKAFSKLDAADGCKDGFINRVALTEWIAYVDDKFRYNDKDNLDLDEVQLEHLFSQADANQDGLVDREEFRRLVSSIVEKKHILKRYLMMIAYADHYRYWPPPLFITVLTLTQLALFAVQGDMTWPAKAPPIDSLLIYDPRRRDQVWRFLTYCLLHAGFQHLILNVIIQLSVGLPLEMSQSWWRVALVYVAGVTSGSLVTSVVEPHVFLVGASGGCYALISGHLGTLILNWKEDTLLLRYRLRTSKWLPHAMQGHIVRIVRIVGVVSFVCTDLILYQNAAHRSTKPSLITHLSGCLAGLLVSMLVLKNRKREHWEGTLQIVCLTLYLALMLLCVLWNVCADRISQLMRPRD